MTFREIPSIISVNDPLMKNKRKVRKMSRKSGITGSTKLTCLLGSPVAHSISPAMHNASFEKLGLDYAYLAFDVNEKTFVQAVNSLITLNAAGWNCTMPLKRLMYDRADVLSDAARLSGAVNTVVNQDGRLFGDNTDGYGFLQSMADAGISCRDKNVVLLGAGGAAAAILAQLALDGASSVTIFSRTGSSTTKLMEDEAARIQKQFCLNISFFDLADHSSLRQSLLNGSILINASSVGMAPDTEASLIPDASFLHPGLSVGDVIYEPRKTKLLRTAEEAGLSTFNGMYMLLHQGAKAFERWTGMEMPVEYIREKYFQ